MGNRMRYGGRERRKDERKDRGKVGGRSGWKDEGRKWVIE